MSDKMSEFLTPIDYLNSFLKFNVGGSNYRIRCATLKMRCESSFLARFAELDHDAKINQADGFFADTDEYYFERPARLFEPIFDFYSTGSLHRPPQICLTQMLQEMEYWEIPRSTFAPCCSPLDTPSSPIDRKVSIVPDGVILDPLLEKELNEFEGQCCAGPRAVAWKFFEDPGSSMGAKIFTLLSILFVLVSVAGLIFGSLPDLQVMNNSTGEREPHLAFQYAEYVCISWFSTEYLARLLAAPRKWEFAKAPLNVIDILTIFPFFMELGLQLLNLGTENLKKLTGLMLVVRILRVLRVARIFKLARYSSGLKSFGATVQNSMKELGMLGLFLVTAIIFFSTVEYFLEKDEVGSSFTSIPAACWWCVVTMTTVGYGDIVPVTVGGKLIASVASISGVLVLAFPITMIVDNFARHYERSGGEKGGRRDRRRRFGKFA